MDIIIALEWQEGFDWPYCEHALTIGYRGSQKLFKLLAVVHEIVQIRLMHNLPI